MFKFKKINSLLFIIFNVFFILAIGLASFFAIFKPFYTEISTLSTILLILFFFCFFIFFIYISKNFSKKQLIILTCINLLFFFLLQLFFGYFFAIKPSWDINHIYDAATKLALNKTNTLPSYFTVLYPNNIFVTILWFLFYKFCTFLGFSFLKASIILNILLVFISILITYFIIYKIFNLRLATLSSFLFLLVTPFYSYSSIFYTDTLTMVFLPLSFLLFLKYKDNKSFIYPIIIGLLLAIGIGIKTNIIIGLIAFFIYLLLTTNTIKNLFVFIAPLLIVFVLSSVLISSVSQSFINRPLKESGLPYTHWIMMGLSKLGGYNQEDVNLSKSYGPDKETIKNFNLEEIHNRLNNYGVSGYLKFLNKKLQFTWGDGTYFASELLSRKPINNFSIQSYVFGNKSFYFKTFSEATHSLLLLFILIGSISLFNSKKKIGYLFNICIFGTFLFLILWETKSRYLVCILPLMVCSASFGINYIITTFNIFKSKNKVVQPLNSK